MKACILGRSAFYYLVQIDDGYAAVWGADIHKHEVKQRVKEIMSGHVMRFAFTSEKRMAVIDFMVSGDVQALKNHFAARAGIEPGYRGLRGRKVFFTLETDSLSETEGT